MTRDLTKAELAGWRFCWDGWPICPKCQSEKLARHPTRTEWPVPADYNYHGVDHDAKCVNCAATPTPCTPADTKGMKDGPGA